jgi:AcrR family transcriptional regulator
MVTERHPADLSMTSSIGRRERKRLDTRDRLVRAALELFAQHGFAATRVEQITERADVAKGTFFNYFKNKEQLLGYLASRQISKVERALAEARTSRKPFRQRFRSLVHELVALPSSTPEMARSVIAAFVGSQEIREILSAQIMGRGREAMSQMIELAQENGEVRRDIKALEIARTFQQSVFGTILLWSVNPNVSIIKVLDSTLDILWSGIRSETTVRKRRK